MSVPRVRTDNPAFIAKVKAYTDDIRRSLAAIDDIMRNAEAVPGDFLDSLQSATYSAQDAAARAAQLAIPKVRHG